MGKQTRVLAMAVAVAALAGLSAMASAATVVVSSFATDTSTAGVWGVSDSRTGTTGSTASIVNLAGMGGNLENNQPLPTGAAEITTDGTNASMAEVGVSGNYGIASSIISSINLAYSYYKSASSGNASAAPTLKLSFSNPAVTGTGDNDGTVTLIYEPYWNAGGTVATDTWLTDTIDATHGLFWANGGFGQANSFGGTLSTLHTLNDWVGLFNGTSGGAFSSAALTDVRVGMGSYNPNQNGYFDDVVINGTNAADTTYNFEPAAVPLPAAAWAGLGLLAALGMGSALKRKLA